MENLEKYRLQINDLDNVLEELLEKRFTISKNIGKIKLSKGMDVFQKEREVELRQMRDYRLGKHRFNEEISSTFDIIIANSRAIQYKLFRDDFKYEYVPFSYDQNAYIAYQGVEGSYSQIAMKTTFSNYQTIHFRSFDQVFKYVLENNNTYGVVPIENSTQGEISDVLDLLRKYDVTICQEIILPVNHCLLGVKNSKLTDVKQVHSHQQALDQSGIFLGMYNFELIPSLNTAVAAQEIFAKNDKSQAVVASREAASLYNLQILAENIQNETENYTRFIVITKDKKYLRTNKFTSLLLTTDHTSGSLVKALNIFQLNNINMVKLLSRPIPGKSWNYQFFIDIEGMVDDSRVRNVINTLRNEVVEIRILGSY